MNDQCCVQDCISPKPGAVEAAAHATDEVLAAFAKALAHPVRIQILRILARRTACVCGDIVSELPLAQSTVSEHLRILKTAGLILGEVAGPRVCYCIDTAAFAHFKSLIDGLPSPRQALVQADCESGGPPCPEVPEENA